MNTKKDFPIFENKKNSKHPLIYFDNASTTQKPQCVIDTLVNYYTQYNANIHRGAYSIAEKATLEFENARNEVANFINANNKEIIFTKGTTESINLIAYTFESMLSSGDEILISEMEHHSNILPWQTRDPAYLSCILAQAPQSATYQHKFETSARYFRFARSSNSAQTERRLQGR